MKLRSRELAKLLGAVPLLLLTAALALPGDAAAQPPRYGYGNPYAGPYQRPYQGYGQQGVDGFITFEGGRCPSIRDHRSNQTYFLSGNMRNLRPGDHVVLSARPASGNSCGVQGPALQVLGVRTIWAGSDHASAYFDVRRDGDFERFILRSRNRGGWYADRYGYLQHGETPQGDRYGQYDQGRPYGNGYPQNGQPQNGQPPNGQYDNGQQNPNTPPYDSGPPPSGQYAPNGQYDNGDAPDVQAPDDQYDDRSGGNRQLISVDGTLDYNRSCPRIRGSNGEFYDLAGDLGNYHDGDRVRLRGFVAGSSSCGGTALEVQEIRRR